MKVLACIAVAATLTALAAPASAQFAKPEDAIKYRKNALFVMQQNFGRVASMASGRTPFDAKVAAESAETAAFMSKLPWAGFMADTDKGETKAKPEIWKEPAKFKEASEKMQGEMTKLAAASKTGNIDQIKTAVAAVGGTCKACHDAYRNQ
ncbi:c-type cytochrome [Polaromonas sp.]|uniref:c-type cytochrome n=1 Tax=Polaromonas sp. TaxID=1869339 RepID=UPI002FCAE9D1